ncbi:MAG TPA: folylpolyglutamate synthase/dihydrofolate synthase family protein [Smithellaceae bacterium]|nr:folylpolyglutamate synthase/dihydrofolate synthase family protein [Smithellaceae bacterium]HRS90250.1 folylpolyglutamate synthase/dihydrofolate synthase family protein [Smithellaceae bacterium]HRV27081.1 folylpolyglutamate synthase/dihydrofolate synthase family protein [Smithellaceae bacterium]
MKKEKINYPDYLSHLNVDIMRLGLKPITELLRRLGNPQNALKTILVAGTNGKGSTAGMIASILQSAGHRVGLYTSPHLLDVRERIKINDTMISRSKLDDIVAYLVSKKTRPLTYFEILTAAAFIYFYQEKIDIAVLEVGLGGRLDATNVCKPLVSVITNVSLEHTAYLGRTLSSIAYEKGDIIKKRGICVTAATQKSVLEVFENICRKRNAKLYQLGSAFDIVRRDHIFDYKGIAFDLKGLSISLAGGFQMINAALAITAIESVRNKGISADEKAIRQGLKKVKLPARLEVLCRKPLFILDGAHNPGGISALSREIRDGFVYRRLILIFACLKDKDYVRMLEAIAPLTYRVIVAPLNTARTQVPDKINKKIKMMGCRGLLAPNVAEAVQKAFSVAADDDLICATGSLYLAAEIKQKFPKIATCDKKRRI